MNKITHVDNRPYRMSYSQSTGELSVDGVIIAKGYSGKGSGRNNPDAQCSRNVGPIPRGRYWVQQPRFSKRVGPVAFDLVPWSETDTCGRSALMIHGDNATNDASEGCIILNRLVRDAIAADRSIRRMILEVTM